MGRSPCCDKASVKRGPWSQEEDAILRSFVERFGNAGNWIALPHKAGLKRCGKSCRLRWLNYLRPAIRHGGFTDEEDNLILSLYGEMGSKWSVIASKLPGRTDNDVKNYWNTKLKKRYFATTTTRETATTPPPPLAAGEDDSIAVDDDDTPSQASHPAPPTPPALVNLDDVVDDNDELLTKSEQLYAELMGLIEQHSATTTTAAPSSGDSVTWSPSSGTSPTASSDGSSSRLQWPVDVQDSTTTLPLSESSSSGSSGGLFFDDSHDVTHSAFGGGSFQDLLGASAFDDVMLAQEMLYYY